MVVEDAPPITSHDHASRLRDLLLDVVKPQRRQVEHVALSYFDSNGTSMPKSGESLVVGVERINWNPRNLVRPLVRNHVQRGGSVACPSPVLGRWVPSFMHAIELRRREEGEGL